MLNRFLNFTNEEYNDNHRLWGKYLFATDIDMIEYNSKFEPQILIETKHGHMSKINLDNIQIKCQLNIAKTLNIPYLMTLYYFPGYNKHNNKTDEYGLYKFFFVFPMNSKAREYVPITGEFLTELNYVKLLYKIKNESMPNDLKLDNELSIVDEPFFLNKSTLKGY